MNNYVESFKENLKTMENPVELAKAAENMVNNFSFNSDPLIADIKADPEMNKHFLVITCQWICYLNKAKGTYMEDGRNEYSTRLGKIIYNALGKKLFAYAISDYDEITDVFKFSKSPAMQFVGAMCVAHKTLQQTFTGLVISYLLVCENKQIEKVMNEIDELQDFRSCPLI